MTSNPYIIAVDGYSSCGKSTFARMIARELGFVYIDSGAMYRSVAQYALENGLIKGDSVDPALNRELDKISVQFVLNRDTGLQETLLNGRNIEKEIRGIEVSAIVSKISQVPEVRQKLVKLQREIGHGGNVVMDGRDIGSTVFPDATFKIFMTADPVVRAERRYKELVEKGTPVDLQKVIENIKMRDYEDENREVSPLRKAHDAVILDNSHMTIAQQMDWFREWWRRILENENGN
ncbi:MAG TPA: (d)CMP kinase [Bacteroidales bacterium]|nr:(d)CMP kinase [Bacteroidales bacterium]